jgi:hypothetical protein
MTNTPHRPHVAIFIDADNVHLSNINSSQLLKIAEHYGELKQCRAYRDWEKFPSSVPAEQFAPLKLEYVQVAGGTNASDAYLIMDACEALGADSPETKIEVFVLVSGDDDFTALCQRIRNKGRRVIGLANRKQTAERLQAACDAFFFLDNLEYTVRRLEDPDYMSLGVVEEFFYRLYYVYDQIAAKDEWVTTTHLSLKLHELVPDYEGKFGKYALSEWLMNVEREFESDGQKVRRIAPSSTPKSTKTQASPSPAPALKPVIMTSDPSPKAAVPKTAPNPTTPAKPVKTAAKSAPKPAISKADHVSDATRKKLLLQAFEMTRDPDGRAHLSKLVHALSTFHEYKHTFGNHRPVTWLKIYKDTFKLDGDYVTMK